MADYTALDYVSSIDRSVELAKSRFSDIDWDSLLLPDRIFLEQIAKTREVAGFYLQNAALESRWGTARQRRSQIALAKQVGQRLRGATAARFTVTFSIVATVSGTVTLPAGAEVRTEEVVDPVRFQLLEDLSVDVVAGTTTATATVENSQTHEDLFVAADRPNQEIVLTQTPYLDGSAVVVAANGSYSIVDDFLDSEAADLHVTESVDNLDRATLRFGNGSQGTIPTGTINVTYRTGGGASGNVPAGAIKVIDGTFTDQSGNAVVITVTNASTADVLGADRESVAEARDRIPRAVRTVEVAVAREDFEDGALEVSGVARALCLTREEEATVPVNTKILYVVPTAGGAPSENLKTAVKAQFLQQDGYDPPPYRAAQNETLRVQTPLYTTITPRVRAYFRSGVTPATGAAAIRSALTDFFAVRITAARLVALAPDVAKARGITASMGSTIVVNPLVDFGFNLQDADGEPFPGYSLTRLIRLLDGLPQVARLAGDSEGLLLNGVAQDVAIPAWGFPVLGTVTVIDAKTLVSL
jgi:hypothetical protein